jgi:hypothetical protein
MACRSSFLSHVSYTIDNSVPVVLFMNFLEIVKADRGVSLTAKHEKWKGRPSSEPHESRHCYLDEWVRGNVFGYLSNRFENQKRRESNSHFLNWKIETE